MLYNNLYTSLRSAQRKGIASRFAYPLYQAKGQSENRVKLPDRVLCIFTPGSEQLDPDK